MAQSEPVTLTLSDVIRHNIRHYRGTLSQRDFAERLDLIDGNPEKPWTQFRVSDIEGGREGRRRTISPEEILVLALELDVSLIDLMTPPSVVQHGPDKGRPVKVAVGTDVVSPDGFFRLAFMIPGHYREKWKDTYLDFELRNRGEVVQQAIEALYTEDELLARFPEPMDPFERLRRLVAEDDVQIIEWIIENKGVGMARKIFFSNRARRELGGVEIPPEYWTEDDEGDEEHE